MTSDINVAGVERWASALGGAALAAYGIRQLKDRSPSGAALTAAGAGFGDVVQVAIAPARS